MKPKTLAELNRIYTRAEESDKELFAEMRSNVLLIAGEHYSRVNARVASQIRQANKTPLYQEQKLRLTKNHMHQIHRTYVSAIMAESPGTTVVPARDNDLQDQKEAELNLSVWQDIKYRHQHKKRAREWCSSFVGIGEVCLKIFWDPNIGEFLGYDPELDENGDPVLQETGEMEHDGTFDENGQPGMQPKMAQVEDKSSPRFSGDFVYEEIFGFNILREQGTQSMDDKHRAWILRKMVDTDDLKFRYRQDPDKMAKIKEDMNETFIVFDANKGSYNKAQNQTLLKEYYWAPCTEYPNGYFAYATKSVVLEEGELPYGIWPLVWAGFDKHPSTPRGRSIMKVARPYQAEINRASSAMAVAQVTLGDDKVLYQAGAKLSPGALLPGVRGIAYQGSIPTVLPGRSGAQYLDYVAAQISELKDVTDTPQDDEDTSGQLDPYFLLYRSASQKKKYNLYIDTFQQDFLVEVTKVTLQLARKYLPDNMLIPAVGKREQINIAEFRRTSPLNYLIHIEAESETLETQLGKQLTFQHILQYVGNSLDPKTVGKLIKNMPFANYADSFDDMTLDEDMAKNDMLALERGENVQATPQADPAYMLKKLAARQKMPDFKFLPPPVQGAYHLLSQQYEQIGADQAAKLAAAKNEYIPIDGALVTCDFYVPPKNPQEQAKRAKVPQRALEWLMQRLQEQGASLDKLEGMNAQNLADMAQMMLNHRQMPPQGQQPGLPPQPNQAFPPGGGMGPTHLAG